MKQGLGENMGVPEEKPQDYNEVYYNDEEPRFMPRSNQFPPNTRGIRSDDFEAGKYKKFIINF